MALSIYLLIIKALIKEKNESSLEKYNYHIIENLFDFINIFINKKYKNIPKYKENKKYIFNFSKINSIIPFSNENKSKNNIYIGVTLNGFLIIFSFNFYNKDNINNSNYNNNINNINDLKNNENIIYNNENFKLINLINSKKLGIGYPLKIMKLESKFLDYKTNQNIFLVSFPSSGNGDYGIAEIIEISQDYNIISILNTFSCYKGLINAIEINLNDNYYLLNCTNGFSLWFYDSNKKEVKSEVIVPKLNSILKENNNDYKDFRTFKNAFFIKKKNLLIVQITFPIQYIFFYTINNENNKFNIIFQSQIKINYDEPYFSDNAFNSCIIEDKYLIIGTKIKKNNNIIKNKNLDNPNNIIIEDNNDIKDAGFYIINLENKNIVKNIQMKYTNLCKCVNCIMPIRNNLFACTLEFSRRNEDPYFKKYYSLMTFKIYEEENGNIKIDEKGYKNGYYKNINSFQLINDYYIICSDDKTNSILKIMMNGNIFFYYKNILKGY